MPPIHPEKPQSEPLQSSNEKLEKRASIAENEITPDDQGSEEDDDQLTKVTEIVEEITSVRTAWWNYRERIFDQLQLDENSRANIQQTREQTKTYLEDLADRLRDANEEQKHGLVKSMVQIRENYDVFTESVLGAERYAYLKRAENDFNDQLKTQTTHHTQVVGDW